jgi:tRNA1(Val) A37 N6-methylase TrmN6
MCDLIDALATTTDAFLGGAVTLVQPVRGNHRSGSDAVLLAACLTGASGNILDMGAGAGAVGLMVAHASPQAHITLAEKDHDMLACADRSCEANAALSARIQTINVDLLAPEAERLAAGLKRAHFDHVLSNPPYRKAGHVRANPDKQTAHVIADDDLDGWLRTAASVLKPGGSLTLIFAADGLVDLLAALKGRFGAVSLLGLHPREDTPAERILVRAIKGRKTPPRLLPGLVLHKTDGSYTPTAKAILMGRSGIDLEKY